MTADTPRRARQFFRRIRAGVLSTHSKRFPGYPAGSAVPFAVDVSGSPILLISDLAAHTQNIAEDRRVSLNVHGDDVVTGPRLTVLGDASRIAPDDRAAVRYRAFFPGSEQYAGFGDFHFHRIDIVAVHWIGGFGDIRWLDGHQFLLPDMPLDARERDIVEHMNSDHSQALADYCRHAHGVTPGAVQMAGIDADGFDVLADGMLLRFEFPEVVADADAARRALVRMVQESRTR